MGRRAPLTVEPLMALCESLVARLVDEGIELPSIYLLVGGRLRCYAARGYFQVVDGFPPRIGIIGTSVDQRRELVVEDAREDPLFIAAIPGLVGEACVPVIVDGSAVGAVNAESTGPLPADWMPALRESAATLAAHISAAGGLPAPSPMQRLARVAVQLAGLDQVAAIEVLTVEAASELSAMRSAMVARILDGVLTCTQAVGPMAEELCAFSTAELDLMASWVLAGTSSHVPGGHDVPAPHPFLARARIRSLSVHPLTAGGRSTGILVVADTDPHPLDAGVVEALELLAAQSATSIATVSALDTLRRRADEDPLTGCRNYGAFVDDLRSGIARQSRGSRLACLLVDVDRFKRVNDEYGHPAGDKLLKEVAVALGGAIRATDRLYRVGGDEFAVTTYMEDLPAVAALAQRLVDAGRQASTSVSVGAAWAGVDEDPSSLRERADQALYEAKRAGRNRALFR